VGGRPLVAGDLVDGGEIDLSRAFGHPGAVSPA
jgi:hypothetical protein